MQSKIALADLNGRAFLDVVTSNVATHNVPVFINDGTGSLGTPQHFDVANDPAGLDIGDLNGDGVLDVVVMTGEGFASVLLGNGDGTFQPQLRHPIGSSGRGVALGDFDRNGVLDFAMSAFGGLRAMFGNGDGTFRSSPFLISGQIWRVAVGDLDLNGHLDIVAQRH